VEGEEGTVEEGDLLPRAIEAGLRSVMERAKAIWLSGDFFILAFLKKLRNEFSKNLFLRSMVSNS
jgi:hypothetical protein